MRNCIKVLAILSILVSPVLIFATGTTETTGTAGDVTLSEPGTYPVVSSEVSYDVLVRQHKNVADIETNDFSVFYQDLTGLKFDWDVIAGDGWQQVVNLRIASGDLPDAFQQISFSRAELLIYSSQGLLQPLQDHIDERAPNIVRMFEAEPWIRETMTAPDGNIYYIPEVQGMGHIAARVKYWIYEPFLDALGMEMPETTEEFEAYLTAVKDGDPNGNGEADEIPLAGGRTWEGAIWKFLMNAFIDTGNNQWLSLQGPQDGVRFIPVEPEFREGLRWMSSLYDQGLIAPESFVQDGSQLQAMGENPTPILGTYPGGWIGTGVQVPSQRDRHREYKPLPPIEGPNGLRNAAYYQRGAIPNISVTNRMENVDAFVQAMDYFFTPEGALRAYVGIQGDDWRFLASDEQTENPYGLTTTWTKTGARDYGTATQNFVWFHLAPMWNSDPMKIEYNEPNPDSPPMEEWTVDYYFPYADPENALPAEIWFSEDQAQEIGELRANLNASIEQFIAQFITGDLDIESDWNAFVRELRNIGYERYIELYNDALK